MSSGTSSTEQSTEEVACRRRLAAAYTMRDEAWTARRVVERAVNVAEVEVHAALTAVAPFEEYDG